VKALELYAGIGGFAEAWSGPAVAVEQSPVAARVHAQNHGHPVWRDNLERVRLERLAAAEADLWWLSPPCQPYTGRGQRRDLADPRARSLVHLLELLRSAQPRFVALENVPGFVGSQAQAALLEALAGYQVQERLLCPTELGVPMRRRRYYLVAARDGDLVTPAAAAPPPRRLADHARPHLDADPALRLPEDFEARFEGAVGVLDPADPGAVAHCFTASYGRSPTRSGAYLRRADGGARRFAPEEIAGLMGFSGRFAFPEEVPLDKRWSLLGNCLSVDAVRAVLTALPVS